MKHILEILSLLLLTFLAGCTHQDPGIPPTGDVSDVIDKMSYFVPTEIAKLPTFDENSINSFENYKAFADKANYLIDILKEKTEFNIPKLDITVEGYKKISNVVNEYGPLVKNYNQLVISAREANPNDQVSMQNFYKSSAVFGAEAAIIYTAAFALPVYRGVGTVYRATGMQTLALKCGTCVSMVLSESHWFVRTALVETSSQTLKAVIEGVQYLHERGITIENFENNLDSMEGDIMSRFKTLNITVPLK